jgi:hypothetical protein
MDKSKALKYKSAFTELYAEDKDFREHARYTGLGFLIAFGSYIQKRKLRKRGAPEWAAYAIPLVTAGLARITLKEQVDRLEKSYLRKREYAEQQAAVAQAEKASQARHERAWGVS